MVGRISRQGKALDPEAVSRPDGAQHSIINLLFLLLIGSTAVQARGIIPERITLDEAITIALLKNPELQVATAQTGLGKFAVERANNEFATRLAPVVSLQSDKGTTSQSVGFSASRLLHSGARINVDLLDLRDDQISGSTGSVRVQVTQPLFRRFGKETTEGALTTAQYQLLSGQRQLHLARINTAMSVITTYQSIIRQQQFLAEHQRAIERAQNLLRTVHTQEQVGRTTQSDKLRANLQLSQARLRATTAADTLEFLRYDFSQLLGVTDIGDTEPLEKQISVPIQQDAKSAIATALENRVDHAQAHHDLAEAKRMLHLSRRQRLPDLELTASYEQPLYGNDGADSDDDGRTFIGIRASSSFTRHAERTNKAEALATVQQKQLELQQSRRRLERDVMAALNNLKRTENEVRNASQIALYASRQLDANGKLLDVGRSDSLQTADVETTYNDALTASIIARSDLVSAYYQLLNATGKLVTAPRELLVSRQYYRQ